MQSDLNRIHNVGNPYQGKYKKVLCVCSAGLLRSPTLAYVLSQDPWNYNTRAVGVEKSYALVPIEEAHLVWADKIVCMNGAQETAILDMITESKFAVKAEVVCINVPDSFGYREPSLIDLMKERIKEYKI